jgi:5,10-methylenetetrahydromethanopterin reductase
VAEFFTLGGTWAPTLPRIAERCETDGWDGLFVVDSQSLAGDCFVALALAAGATQRLQIGTGVSNPLTRHPASGAAGIATVHAVSKGRAIFGVGRGDSALSHLGLAPSTVRHFEHWISVCRRLLAGDEVPFDELEAFVPSGAARPADALGLAKKAAASRLHFLDPSLPQVPIEIAATGPAVLGVAGRHADRVLSAVGADPVRVAWALETARQAGREAMANGMRTVQVKMGAFVNVVCHNDVATARTLISGGLATFARFSVMDGAIHSPVNDAQREVLTKVHDAYDMTNHTRSGSNQAAAMTNDFIDSFGIAGTPEHCVARLRELEALGVERFVIIGPSAGSDREAGAVAQNLFVREVLPAFASL